MELAKRVWDFSTSQGLLQPGDRVVLGVSGGPDSLCLLDVLAGLSARHRLRLTVAYLNHRLRPESEAEAEFVREQAEARQCLFVAGDLDVEALAQAKGQSVETTARDARYDFLSRVARQVDARLIAVAHTADDQAETVLMHLLRGSGLRGLRGMLPKRMLGQIVGLAAAPRKTDPAPPERQPLELPHPPVLYLIRPLLAITRAEVVEYCAAQHLEPRFDRSNSDVRYFRNRVRHELLPMLKGYNPNLPAVLARLGASTAGDYEIWQEAVRGLWQKTGLPEAARGDRVMFDRQRWLALSPAEQRALLRLGVEHLAGDLDELDFAPIEAAAAYSRRAAPGRSCQVLAGLVLKVEPDRISLVYQQAEPEKFNGPRVVDDELAPGWQMLAERLGPGEWTRAEVETAARWTAYVDAGRLAHPLGLRGRRPGDRFQPLGMTAHTVKLSDYFVNRKIPAGQRGQWPLVTCGDDIVWVMGLHLDERCKVSETTQAVLRLSVRRTDSEGPQDP